MKIKPFMTRNSPIQIRQETTAPVVEELKTVILRLIGRTHVERKEPPSKKAPIKPPTGRKKPPIKEPPDPPNPGHRRDDQVPIGDPPPKRGPKRVFRSNANR